MMHAGKVALRDLPKYSGQRRLGFGAFFGAALVLLFGIACVTALAQDTSPEEGSPSATKSPSSQGPEQQENAPSESRGDAADEESGEPQGDSQTYTFSFERMAAEPEGASSQAAESQPAQPEHSTQPAGSASGPAKPSIYALFFTALLGFAVTPAYAQENTASDQQQDQSEEQNQPPEQNKRPNQESGTYTFTFERMAKEPEGEKKPQGGAAKSGTAPAESKPSQQGTAPPQGSQPPQGGETKQGAAPAESAPPQPETTQPQDPSAPSGQNPLPAPVETIPVQPTDQARKDQSSPPPSAPASPVELGTVVVTATKRAQNLRDIAGSVSALRGEELEQRGYQSQDDFLKLVPGVTLYDDGSNARRITVRGVAADAGTTNTTGVFIGDVPFDDPFLPRVTLDPNPFDLARIEVLKGPQGTLFGGSALNGALRYIPQAPILGQWQTKAFAEYDAVHKGDSDPIAGGALNIPVGDDLAFRLVGHRRRSPGWIDDLTRGNEAKDVNKILQSGGRVLALWQPDERWTITAMGLTQNTLLKDIPVADNSEGRLTRSNTPRPSPTRTRYDLETLGVQYAFDRFDLQSQTSRTFKRFLARQDASRVVPGDNPPPGPFTIFNNHSEAFAQELRLSSNAGFDPRWKWGVGAFYRRVRLLEISDILANDQALPLPAGVQPQLAGLIPGFSGFITPDGQINTSHFAPDLRVSEAALYGEATRTFGDALELTVGLRAFRTAEGGAVASSGVATANGTLANGRTETVNRANIVEKGLNPKFALRYTVNRHLGAYAAVARGFRFGGIQSVGDSLTADVPDTYKSDVIWNFELGLRTQWLDNTLQADLTPFWLIWKDPQLVQIDRIGLTAFLDNVGGARSRGVELAMRYLTPLPGLSLASAGSLVDTVTTKPFTTVNGVDTQPGTRWPLSARWQTSTTLAYQHPLIGEWTGGVSLVHTYISSAWNTLDKVARVFGYQTLDLNLNLSNPAWPGRPQLALVVNNLTDRRGIVGANFSPLVPDRTYIRPRTLILRLSGEF